MSYRNNSQCTRYSTFASRHITNAYCCMGPFSSQQFCLPLMFEKKTSPQQTKTTAIRQLSKVRAPSTEIKTNQFPTTQRRCPERFRKRKIRAIAQQCSSRLNPNARTIRRQQRHSKLRTTKRSRARASRLRSRPANSSSSRISTRSES